MLKWKRWNAYISINFYRRGARTHTCNVLKNIVSTRSTFFPLLILNSLKYNWEVFLNV